MKEQEKTIKENLKYLDNILGACIVYDSSYTFYDDVFIKTNKAMVSDFRDSNSFISAIECLKKKELIEEVINVASGVKITYQGIIKLSQGGFYGDYQRQKRKDLLQSFFWTVAILTFIITVVVPSILKLYKSLKG